MSEPTPTWQRMFRQVQESRQVVDRFYEMMLAEFHAAEHDRIILAQKIIAIIHRADDDIQHATESDWAGICHSVFEDIEKLCTEQLQKGTDNNG